MQEFYPCSPGLVAFLQEGSFLCCQAILQRCFSAISSTTSFLSAHWTYRSFYLCLSIIVITSIMILSLTIINMANQYGVLALLLTMNETYKVGTVITHFTDGKNKGERNCARSKWKVGPKCWKLFDSISSQPHHHYLTFSVPSFHSR